MEKKKINKNKETSVQKYRFFVQLLFMLISIWIGIQFYFFVRWIASNGTAHYVSRPPGVEGFLPISSLMSVYYFLRTGLINQVHPAGFFIFIAIVTVSFLFGKAFCSWICPVGFISELIGDFGEKFHKKIFKKKLVIPKFLDYPLRSLKYIILGFFIYIIFFSMSQITLNIFLNSTYNKVADLKLYDFFANISEFSLIVIGSLFILSIIIRNFWCRYLCPYGALLGLISLFSPDKIKRDPVSCIDCGLCNKVCPSNIKVDKLKTVISDECTTCLNCIDVCPVEDCLQVKSLITRKKINKKYIGAAILIIYFAIIGAGMISGNWHSDVKKSEYLKVYKNINKIGHPESASQMRQLNKEFDKNYKTR